LQYYIMRAGWLRNRGSILGGYGKGSLLHSDQTGSRVYPMCTGGSFPGTRATGV
jgi:hypothetical protein